MKRILGGALISALLISLLTPVTAQAVSATPTTYCWQYECNASFPYTGDYYRWIAPFDANFGFSLWGAQGGDAKYGSTIYTAGGKGGYVTKYIALTEGQVVYIYPGGQGASSNDANINAVVAGGYNGGGNGYDGSTTAIRGAGGGGATDIRVGGNALSDRVLVAGGGAGGSSYTSYGTKTPGVGGGTAGGDGATGTYGTTSAYNGKGGTSGGGGSKGTLCGVGGSNGSLGAGGNGETSANGSAGGGGGYYGGGGGGCGTSAGGGSGFLSGSGGGTLNSGSGNAPDPITGNNLTGRLGDGYVKITYSFSLRVSSFTSTQSSPTKVTTSASIPFTLTFNQDVADFAAADLSFVGTSTCNTPVVTGSGATYSITVTNCSEGRLTLQIASQSATSWTTGPPAAVKSPTIIIDRSAPSLTSVGAPADGTYSPNSTPTFSVAFGETITITGTPRLTLTVGSLTKYATYDSMSDSKTASFIYTVGSSTGEFDTDGIAVATSIDLNGGSITDPALNALSSLSFSAPTLTNVLIAQPPAAPTINSITVGSGTLSIAFTAGALNGSTLTNYEYATNGSTFKALTSPSTASPILISTVSTGSSNLSNGTTYQIRIRAITSWGQGASSSQVSAIPLGVSTISISLTGGVVTVSKGQQITITATVDTAGKLTFFSNGSRIGKCIALSVTPGTKTCTWKPAHSGGVNLSATLLPTSAGYTSSSTKLAVSVGRRVGNR